MRDGLPVATFWLCSIAACPIAQPPQWLKKTTWPNLGHVPNPFLKLNCFDLSSKLYGATIVATTYCSFDVVIPKYTGSDLSSLSLTDIIYDS